MGTVATLLDEHVSFRCTSVDRIGIRGYIPGLQYEGGVVKFLLNRGGTIPSPALLNRNHERLVAELEALEESTGVPVVRFKAGESKEDIARPYQDEATAAGRPGLVLVGKAQERTSVVAGLRRRHLSRASPQPSPHRLAAPVLGARPLVLLLRRPRVGTGLRQDLHLRALPAVVLRQRARVGQVPAGQGRGRLRGSRQRAAQRRGPRRRPSHLRPPRCRPSARPPGPHDGRRPRPPVRPRPPGRVRVVLLHRPARGLRHRGVRPAAPGPGLVRGGHRRPPRPRTSRAGLLARRPHGGQSAASTRPPDASPPRSSPATPPPSSRSTTSHRRPRPT